MMRRSGQFWFCMMMILLVAVCLGRIADAQTTPSSPAPSSSGGTPGGSGQAPSGAGGSLSIEATILAYEGLEYDARSIVNAITPTLATGSRIIIATPSDVKAILQLRIVLAQVDLLTNRLTEVANRLLRLQCKIHPPAGFSAAPIGALFSTPSDISTMLTTAASTSAITESITSQPANLLDASLMNALAADLVARTDKDLTVYMPSAIPSGLDGIFAYPNLQNTDLYKALLRLDTTRGTLADAANKTIATPACKKDPSLNAARSIIVAAFAVTDKFEAGLFGGNFVLPPTSLTATPSPSSKDNSKSSTSKPNAIANTITISTSNGPKPAPSAPAASSPGSFQQLLYVDFLLSELRSSNKGRPSNDPYLLSVHTLESGGSQLTKQQLFLGTRGYFSGGAVATFALIGRNGALACSGVTYGYRGYVQADDVSRAIQPGVDAIPNTNNKLPSTNSYTPTCVPTLSPPH